MKLMFIICFLYIIIANIVSFVMYYIDKERAKRDKWRISEKALLLSCFFGGSIGGLLGMKIFRHKTKHKKFTIGVPAIFGVHILMVSALISALLINSYISVYSSKYTNLPNDIKVDAIIILGAAVHGDNVSNPLRERLEEGYRLYKEGVADKILVTGDHGRDNYDEVNTMRNYLMDKGVEKEDIFMDHAGFDTYSSMYRARDIFEVKTAVVTSQNYHNERAIYMGRKLGLEVYGSPARDVYIGHLAKYREVLARVKAFIVVRTKPEPKYLGDAIPVSGDGTVTEDGKS